MLVSELIRQAAKREAARNPMKPAFKHLQRAVNELGEAVKAIHDIKEPETKQIQDDINKVTGLLFKIMVPVSQRARRPA